MQFKNDSVLVGLTAESDFPGFVTNLTNLGMQIVDSERDLQPGRRLAADQPVARRRPASPDAVRPRRTGSR